MISKKTAIDTVTDVIEQYGCAMNLDLAVYEKHVVELSDFFIIPYQSKSFLTSGIEDEMIFGVSPYVVSKNTGLIVARLPGNLEYYLAIKEFEIRQV